MATTVVMKDGNREDLIDVITNISPDETPLMNKFGKTDASAMTHAWLTDALGAAADNMHLEDADFQAAPATPRTRLDNYVQIFQRGVYVTDSQEAVKKAGIKSELAYQMKNTMKVMAKDVERAIYLNSTKAAGDENTPGKLGGVVYWNDQNVVNASTDGGANTDLDEKRLNDAIQLAWAAGGSPELVIVSGKNKRTISGFTANSQKTRDMGDKKLIQVVDFYESDFGLVKMLAHRMAANTRIDILETQYFKLAYLIPFKVEDMPRTGLRKAKNVSGQLTLECRTQNAHAAITNLTA